METGLNTAELPGHTGDVFSIDCTSNGKKLVSSGTDNKIKIWDVEKECEE